MTLAAGEDGFHHPSSEDELIGLVKRAHDEHLKLRVRGAAHSVGHAIYTDPLDAVPNKVSQQEPPDGNNINVMLDRYKGWAVKPEAPRLVRAEAGIHLGEDPDDPTGSSPEQASLLYQLSRCPLRWTLSDVGGITHQTVSGFTATGSAGGSLRYSANENVHAMEVIDGTGVVRTASATENPDLFHCMVPSLGLLGVVSRITFECVDTFNICGKEAITDRAGCAVDLFGPGDADRPSLKDFLVTTDYTRIEWWPQRGAERILVWQASKIDAEPGFVADPYKEFPDGPILSQFFASIVFTILGNRDDLRAARPALRDAFKQVPDSPAKRLGDLPASLGRIGEVVADFIEHAVTHGVDEAVDELLVPFAPLIREELPNFFPRLLELFVRLDRDRPAPKAGQPQRFRDAAWKGLPMDNAASDHLMPTEFTEIWLPLGRAQEAMGVLDRYFSDTDEHTSYERTGTYAWELYAEKPNDFWLNPAYTDGSAEDEWKDGAFRIDIYWFARNAGDPAQTFYPQFWNLLRDKCIPYRLHWGKFLPDGDTAAFAAVKAQYPKWDDFLDQRAAADPDGTFLNEYWRTHLGLPPADGPTPA